MAKTAIFLGWAIIIFGLARIGMALYVLHGIGAIEYPRYLGLRTTGETIDAGIKAAVFGFIFVLLGTILGKRRDESSEV